MLARRQLINGFQIINNKMAEALNQSMDLGFYYYISVTLEHSRRDSVLAVLFFVLVAGIVLGILRCRPLTLFSYNRSYGNGRFNDRAIWNFSSVFLVFRFMDCFILVYEKEKKDLRQDCILCFWLPQYLLFFYDQTNVPTDTMIKRNI